MVRICLPSCSSLRNVFRLLTLLSPFMLAQVQATVDELSRKAAPGDAPSDRMVGWNVARVVVGWSLLLIRVALSVPKSPP